MKAPAKRAGSRKTLNLANLEALGPERLAVLLMDVADGDAAIKRRLRLELAAAAGPEDLASEIDKRMETFSERRTRVHWRKHAEFVWELDSMRGAITGPLAEQNPFVALEMLWRFLALAAPVLARSNDAKGDVSAIFVAAVDALGALSVAAKADAQGLAERVFEALTSEGEVIIGGLTLAVLPALDTPALTWLRTQLDQVLNRRARTAPLLRRALQQICDAMADADGYGETWTPAERQQPAVGAQIAARLLHAGRTDEALKALQASRPAGGVRTRGMADWDYAWLQALEAAGRSAEAQELRWAAFEERLDAELLRDHLKRLADFDDVVAEDRAMAHARQFSPALAALRFLVDWPALPDAAALVLSRVSEIKFDLPELVEPAIRSLEGRSPLAAALLLRGLIMDTARWRRTEHYRAAHRWLLEAASLEPQIADHGALGTNQDFLKALEPVRRF